MQIHTSSCNRRSRASTYVVPSPQVSSGRRGKPKAASCCHGTCKHEHHRRFAFEQRAPRAREEGGGVTWPFADWIRHGEGRPQKSANRSGKTEIVGTLPTCTSRGPMHPTPKARSQTHQPHHNLAQKEQSTAYRRMARPGVRQAEPVICLANNYGSSWSVPPDIPKWCENG